METFITNYIIIRSLTSTMWVSQSVKLLLCYVRLLILFILSSHTLFCHQKLFDIILHATKKSWQALQKSACLNFLPWFFSCYKYGRATHNIITWPGQISGLQSAEATEATSTLLNKISTSPAPMKSSRASGDGIHKIISRAQYLHNHTDHRYLPFLPSLCRSLRPSISKVCIFRQLCLPSCRISRNTAQP